MSSAKKTVFATSGCLLLSSIEPVDKYLAEGHRRSTESLPSLEDAKRLVDEERRRTTTDKLQKFVLDAKYLYRNGAFGLSQNEECIQRITCLTRTKVAQVDLSNIHLCDMLVDSLADYLASPSCIVTSINVANTKLIPRNMKKLAQAAASNSKLQFFQASRAKLSTEMLIRSKRIQLPRMALDHLDLSAIAAFLLAKKKPLVEVLELSGNDLTGPPERNNLFGGVEILAEAIPGCIKLTRLILNHVNLRSDGLVLLALGLHGSKSIRSLELVGNDIQKNVSNQVNYNGIDSLCEALRGNHTLQVLILGENDLDYTSMMKLAQLLRVNDSIKTLDLSKNPLGSAAMTCISMFLQANIPLLELNLADTMVSCRGCVALADGLVHNSTLQSLDLSRNPDIQTLGYTHLIGAMERNISVTKLKLSPSAVHDESISRLDQLTEANIAYQSMKKSLASFNFEKLSRVAQTNFVAKLDLLSEDELCLLVSNQSFIQCKLADGQLSALQYYSSLDMYTPLKRLVWAYDALGRKKVLEARRQKQQEDEEDEQLLWEDQPLIELQPATKQKF